MGGLESFLLLHSLNFGELPEWSNGAVSKTVDLLCGSEGSNPSLSANQKPKR